MVVPDDLPSDVRQFVLDTLDSIDQLELLAMLIAAPHRWWDAASAGRALGIDTARMQRDLELLATRNLLAVKLGTDVNYRFEPGNDSLRARSEAFAAAYRQHPHALFRMMAGRPKRAIHDFADAFRIRRK